ncbi:MAG: hypothetical protein IT440_11640 [Phycisphaeraceae bacterium]|nr:hypothetical protein [Phycisphaeraceae bacterium]
MAMLERFRPVIHEHIRREGGRVTVDLNPHPHDKRLAMWMCRLLLLGDAADGKLANEILESLEFNHACHFCGAAAAVMLKEHSPRLSPAAVANLERFLRMHLSDWMTEDFRFHGANDNAPFECALILAAAGELFNAPVLVDFVRTRWEELNRLLDLRGTIHECNSPTYTAVSLATVADMANFVQNPQLQAWALRAEQRIWQELLLHFHPGLGFHIGPYSRGYLDDNTSQSAMTMITLLAGLGEVSPMNPMKCFFHPPAGTFSHNSWFFQQCSLCQCLLSMYHVPEQLAQAVLDRPAPWSVRTSNEFMAINGAPAGETSITVHGREDWAMGSFGSRTWGGQTVPLHLLYRRRPAKPNPTPDEHLHSIRSVFTRMAIHSQYAGFPNRDLPIDKELGLDQGAAFAVQHEGTALLAYVPQNEADDCRTIRSSVVFPLHQSEPDEVMHGDRVLPGFSASFAQSDWSFVRDGDVYLAFYPLVSRQDDAQLCTQQYSTSDKFGLISIYNRCAFAGRTYTRQEVRRFCAGFVVEVASASEVGSFADFRKRAMTGKIEQFQYASEWWLRYRRDVVDLELRIDSDQLNLRRAAAQGRLVSTTTWLETEPAMPLLR